MKNGKGLEDFSLEELNILLDVACREKSIDSLVEDILLTIKSKEDINKSNLNVSFDLKMFIQLNIFSKDEMNILVINGITNLQELIDCNLKTLKGINSTYLEKLDWARNFYDMRDMSDRGLGEKNYEKSKRRI
jgi:hypothetical protein